MTRPTRQEILELNPQDFFRADVSSEEILWWFVVLDAAWLYKGDPDPSKPHAELVSGKCSNGYFNCRRVLCRPNLCEILACQLKRKLVSVGITHTDWVVGSAYSAITWSYEVARAFGASHAFVEKDPTDEKGKRMLWKEEIPEGATVLQAEELITTLGTTQEVCRAVQEKNPLGRVVFLPAVGACIHRPAKLPVEGSPSVITLIEKEVWAVDPAECLYCKVGSPRLKPKANWDRLMEAMRSHT